MDFDKDNFEEDNELAPLEEEEAGDVEEVTITEVDELGSDDDADEEAPAARRGSGEPQRAAAGASAPRKKAARKPAKKAAVKKAKPAKKSAAKKAAKKSSGKKKAKKPAKKASRGKKKKR
jgi:DNA end-binding protein Ku